MADFEQKKAVQLENKMADTKITVIKKIKNINFLEIREFLVSLTLERKCRKSKSELLINILELN